MDIIRILVISENFDVMQGLQAVLQLESNFQVVGNVRSVPMGLHMVEAMTPDVILLDAHGVAEPIKQIRTDAPDAQIIAISTESVEARTAGAFACLMPSVLDAQHISDLINRAYQSNLPAKPA